MRYFRHTYMAGRQDHARTRCRDRTPPFGNRSKRPDRPAFASCSRIEGNVMVDELGEVGIERRDATSRTGPVESIA